MGLLQTLSLSAILMDVDNTLYEGYDRANESGMHAASLYLAARFGGSKTIWRERIASGRSEVHRLLPTQASRHSRLLYIKQAVEDACGKTHAQVIMDAHNVFWEAFLRCIVPRAGIFDFINLCRKQGIKLGVVSNLTADIQLQKLTVLGLDGFFDIVVTSEEVGVEKPHRASYEYALQKLALEPGQVLMVGDEWKADIMGAREAGIHPVFMSNGAAPAELSVPVVKDFYELEELVFSENGIQVVIPMAGQGSRFTNAGFTQPKPLIVVDGKTMIEHVVGLFPEKNFVFVCREEHIENTGVTQLVTNLKPEAKIISIQAELKGPVHGVLEAFDVIDDNTPVVVNYCDFNMRWNYKDFIATMQRSKVGGAVVCYKGFHPHLLGPNFYAGVKLDSEGKVVEVREKYSFTPDKMDTWQSCGTYYFASGAILKKYFKMLIDKGIECNGEHYVSLVYNLLIADNVPVAVYPIDYFCQWGTPEDLEEYQSWMKIISEHEANGTQVFDESIAEKFLQNLRRVPERQWWSSCYYYWVAYKSRG